MTYQMYCTENYWKLGLERGNAWYESGSVKNLQNLLVIPSPNRSGAGTSQSRSSGGGQGKPHRLYSQRWAPLLTHKLWKRMYEIARLRKMKIVPLSVVYLETVSERIKRNVKEIRIECWVELLQKTCLFDMATRIIRKVLDNGKEPRE